MRWHTCDCQLQKSVFHLVQEDGAAGVVIPAPTPQGRPAALREFLLPVFCRTLCLKCWWNDKVWRLCYVTRMRLHWKLPQGFFFFFLSEKIFCNLFFLLNGISIFTLRKQQVLNQQLRAATPRQSLCGKTLLQSVKCGFRMSRHINTHQHSPRLICLQSNFTLWNPDSCWTIVYALVWRQVLLH